jgi:hypothetical protein
VSGTISTAAPLVEYRENDARAREARSRVVAQIGGEVIDSQLTGSSDYLARRIKGVIAAQRSGSLHATRSALIEVAAAAASWAASLDIHHIEVEHRNRRREHEVKSTETRLLQALNLGPIAR